MLVGIVVGLIVGFVASKVVNLRGDDPRLGIGVAVGGAIVLGILYSGAGVTAFNPWGLLSAAAGAAAGVAVWCGVRSRCSSHAPQTHRSSY